MGQGFLKNRSFPPSNPDGTGATCFRVEASTSSGVTSPTGWARWHTDARHTRSPTTHAMRHQSSHDARPAHTPPSTRCIALTHTLVRSYERLWCAAEGTQPRGTGWRSVSVCRGAPRPRWCLSQSVTDASRASVLVKLRGYPEIRLIPDSSYIAKIICNQQIIQGSSGSQATEQR